MGDSNEADNEMPAACREVMASTKESILNGDWDDEAQIRLLRHAIECARCRITVCDMVMVGTLGNGLRESIKHLGDEGVQLLVDVLLRKGTGARKWTVRKRGARRRPGPRP